jgi:lipopolysaccharide heptosyltransferase II
MNPTNSPDALPPRRVLAVRLDNLGDVLMTTPALAAMRESLPGVHLALLAAPSGLALAPHLPMVDEVIPYAAPWVQHERAGDVAADHALLERLAQGRFDAAVIFTVCTQSALPAALMCRLAGIPLRLAHSRENPYGLLTHWVRETDVDVGQARHEVQRQLDLVATRGWRTADERMRFALRDQDHAQLDAVLGEAAVDLRAPWIAVHVGATAASRRWPPQRFGQAAEAIAQDSGCQVLYTGSTGEQPLIEQARQAMRRPSVSLAGRLSLGALGALIARSQLLLSNNSGPVHLAAALGTPVVDLYALTNPQHTPWAVPSRVLNVDVPCRNCLKSVCPAGHHQCLLGVPPEAAAGAALELMTTEAR